MLFDWLFDPFRGTEMNPATGLPMMTSGAGGADCAGNPYGEDLHSRTMGMSNEDMGSSWSSRSDFGSDSFGFGASISPFRWD